MTIRRWAARSDSMQVTLPWPPKDLSPNARVHWGKLARIKKQFREACAWTAKEQGASAIEAKKLDVSVLFFPPDKRVRDRDNMIAAMKSGFDGLADVLGVDDGKWRVTFDVADQIGGMVRVTIKASE